jgi:glycosyltransferase involved in cell wall biosynthesis
MEGDESCGEPGLAGKAPNSHGRIGFLTTGLSVGGAETQLVRLGLSLKKRGWDIQIISMIPPQAFVAELKDAGVQVRTLGMRRGWPDLRAIPKLGAWIRGWRPDLLACFMYHANILGRIVGKASGVPVVLSSIRSENFGGAWRQRMMRWTDRMCGMTIVNSTRVAESIMERNIVPAHRIRVIHNGIHLDNRGGGDEARACLRRNLGVENSDFLWIAVGRLEAPKDYGNLLHAFSRIDRSDKHLAIAGGGPLMEALKRQACDLHLQDRFHLLGFRNDVAELLQAADALVLSSAWEGLPNSVMEALSAGKPIVATRVGGVPELVHDRESGLLVPPGNPQALSEAMRRMMEMPGEQRKRMGEAGRAHIRKEYDMTRVVEQWEDLFVELMSGNGPTAGGSGDCRP